MVFTNNKSCIFIVKNVKNAHVTHFQKKLAICLTERTFIHETEGKSDLESELDIYLQFFTD